MSPAMLEMRCLPAARELPPATNRLGSLVPQLTAILQVELAKYIAFTESQERRER